MIFLPRSINMVHYIMDFLILNCLCIPEIIYTWPWYVIFNIIMLSIVNILFGIFALILISDIVYNF